MATVDFKFEGVSEWDAAVAAMVVRVEAGTVAAFPEIESAAQSLIRPKVEKSRTLGDSVKVNPPTGGGGSWSAELGPTAPYTRVIELGHKGAQNKPPHPWFKPGFSSHGDELGAKFVKGWAKALGA